MKVDGRGEVDKTEKYRKRAQADSYGTPERIFCSLACPKNRREGQKCLEPLGNTPTRVRPTAPVLSQSIADGFSPSHAGYPRHAHGVVRSYFLLPCDVLVARTSRSCGQKQKSA